MRPSRAWVLAGVLVASAAAACGGGSDSAQPASSASRLPAVDLAGDFDTTVTVNDKPLHVTCAGRGPVTVVVVTAYGEATTTYSALMTDLAKDNRVCSYDRPGNGLSPPSKVNQTFRSEAADLSALLTAVELGPPYVLVAHSLGGGVAVEFAAQHQQQVQGLLLLDATPVGWLEAMHEIPASVPGGQELQDGYALFTQPATNQERFDGLTAFLELRQITSLGSIPIVVDNAANARDELGLPPEYAKAVSQAWNKGQQHFARLSTAGRLQLVPGGHYVHQDQPELVLQQVRTLLKSGT